MARTTSECEHEAASTMPAYVDPDQVADANNIRMRRQKLHGHPVQLRHVVLNTIDHEMCETANNPHLTSRFRHSATHLILLVFTCLLYTLQAISSYVSEDTPAFAHFWSHIRPMNVSREYASNFRPSATFEYLLLRAAEVGQAAGLVYVLSFIFKRSPVNYLYRHPSMFDRSLCLLLVSAISLRTVSQVRTSPEISAACLCFSYILLIGVCRTVAVRIARQRDKYRSIDLAMLRYILLNSLFLYTTSIGYLAFCVSMQCLALHVDAETPLFTTIGLSTGILSVVTYVFLDRLVYREEFRSIWTPYLCMAVAASCLPLRQLVPEETYPLLDRWGHVLPWAGFGAIALVLVIRVSVSLLRRCRTKKTHTTPIIAPPRAAKELSSKASKRKRFHQI